MFSLVYGASPTTFPKMQPLPGIQPLAGPHPITKSYLLHLAPLPAALLAGVPLDARPAAPGPARQPVRGGRPAAEAGECAFRHSHVPRQRVLHLPGGVCTISGPQVSKTRFKLCPPLGRHVGRPCVQA